MRLVYFGLGSNLGDREALIRSAVGRLHAGDLRLRRVSKLFETEPEGLRDQPMFINAVAEFESDLSPRELLNRALGVEQDLGRVRTVPNGPRTIDIDLLLCGDLIVSEAGLIVPHPRYLRRRFVLEPLVELDAEMRDPVSGRRLAGILEALSQ